MSTREHALFVPPLLRKHGVERFVLVTSPTHIHRAMRAFEAEGLHPVPSMSAMRSSRPRRAADRWWSSRENLSISAQAIYDYFGLVYYWSRGWI